MGKAFLYPAQSPDRRCRNQEIGLMGLPVLNTIGLSIHRIAKCPTEKDGIMAKVHRDDEVDLKVLSTRKIGIVGYGNQGRAQALNIRDSGFEPMVANRDDEYKAKAIRDGFKVHSISHVAKEADVILVLIPDEVQPQVYHKHIQPHLWPGDVLCFASGYNVYYKAIEPPEGIGVIMVAPRMIGEAVRNLYKNGLGFPCLVACREGGNGQSMPIALALAKAIGATRLGAFESSFKEEVMIDLFAEQMLWPGILKLCLLYFEKLTDYGCDPEVVTSELHLSGEFVEIAKAMITHGFFGQLKLHSQTSQYGQLSCMDRMAPPELLAYTNEALEKIASGKFHAEWAEEQKHGKPNMKRLWQQIRRHPLAESEAKLDTLRKIVAKSYEGRR
ncbi:MAG: ketol-acid reductoisomerase [Phycisphaerales bacterium]|nr:MAG: ketol-acid reductoisomerase [Phycisphaerales bacterium]